jgi:hypothetical protein
MHSLLHTNEQETTTWKTQSTMSNGSPTYERKFYGQGVTVKKAKSGKWFFITCIGSDIAEPTGPYASAEEAMQAYDVLRF